MADIVPALHGLAAIEQAVPQLVSGFDQRSPRLGTDNAVHRQAATVLESPNRNLGRGAKLCLGVITTVETESCQASLDIPDGFTGRAVSVEPHDPIVAEIGGLGETMPR